MTLSATFYALGYICGALAFYWMAKRRKLLTEGVFAALSVGLIGGLVCANLVQYAVSGQPGKTILGGLAGGYLAVYIYKLAIGLKRPLGDLFAVALSAGEAVGRWGCAFGGCCYGKPSTYILNGHHVHEPFSVYDHGVWRYPTQAYLSLTSLATLCLLVALERKRPLQENGLFYIQGSLFCISRFLIEFLRADDPVHFGLTLAQWACLAGLAFFGARLTTMVSGSLLRSRTFPRTADRVLAR